jgi:stage II sporulation protein R
LARKVTLGVLLLMTGTLLMIAGFSLPARSAAAGLGADPDWTEQVLRLHVVAHSDSKRDQALKRAVRDALLDEITPILVQAASLEEARAAVIMAMPLMEQTAAAVVAQWGESYQVEAELGRAHFPGKAYGLVFLPAGEYTALQLKIGEAQGANWWCILFPPMCFVDWATGIVLEPAPGSSGATTTTVSRTEVLAMLDEEALERMPVKARSGVLQWLRKQRLPVPARLQDVR